MELTKKQLILIAAVSGAILLLTVGAILIFTPRDGETVPEPTATAQPTDTPSPMPTPTITPAPTIFLLPLVPQWDTPWPTEAPAAGVFAPHGATPAGTEGPGTEA